MFGRKKENKRGPADGSRGRMGVSELGLLGMDIDDEPDNLDGDDFDDDPSLEAELLAITSGKLPSRPVRRPRANNIEDLDRMIAESLRDSPSDEEEDDNLENDPSLLDELQQLAPGEEQEEPANLLDTDVPDDPAPPLPARPAPPPPAKNDEDSMMSTLQERLDMYKAAQANAKSAGETSKVRRLDRGIKTIESLIKSAKAGKHINEDDIPPPVATGGAKPTPPPPVEEIPAEEPPPPIIPTAPCEEDLPPQEDPPPQESQPELIDGPPEAPDDAEDAESRQVHALLCERRDQYKKAALIAKKQGDMTSAVQFIRTAKQFDAVIGALESGQAIDISGMPPPPPGFEDATSTLMPSQMQTPHVTNEEIQNSSAPETEEDPDVFKAPSAPATTMESLLQRLEKYQTTQKEAQAQGNSSKARRMGRIVKQYEDAIKLHKAGKPVPYDDLPDPPGFAPIPRDVVGDGSSQRPAPAKPAPTTRPPPPPPPVADNSEQPDRSTPPALPPRNVPKNDGSAPPLPARPPPNTEPGVRPGRKKSMSVHEKQLTAVIERQRLFREAALQAKQQGNIEAAKEYLRISKGFTAMIEASKGGLPINLDSAPVPPQLMREDSFEVVEHEDCLPPGDRDEMYEKLEKDLQTQIEMCTRNRDYFSHLGDVSNAKKFHQLYEHSKKDLSSVKYAFKRGDPVPRFHYETRIFSIVQCCTDLTDNDLELTIVRGINYACQSPRDIDTYVKIEFPFPTETPFRDRTRTVKDTNNPEYNQCFVIPINRKSRALARVFKQRAIKLEIGVKGGFFRGDSVLGTVQVKLLPLEKKCTIHEAFDIMDGRKPQGGKLEVKVRIRDPLLSKQVEEIKEKWLVIDQYLAK